MESTESKDSKVSLIATTIDKWALLEKLLQLYAYDFSEFTGDEINGCGDYGFGRLLRHYWNGKNPDPFVIKIGNNIAGFVMVRIIQKDDVEYHSVAEFFILRKYRRSGLGKRSAQTVFKMFPGKWYVDIIQSNIPACTFWERVISEYTEGKYTHTTDKEQKKLIFTFEK